MHILIEFLAKLYNNDVLIIYKYQFAYKNQWKHNYGFFFIILFFISILKLI